MAEETHLVSQWMHTFEGLSQSPQEFYDAVESAVRKRNSPNVKFSRSLHKEGGLFSAAREYLRVERGDLFFEICGAPFGDGFFVSARLVVKGSSFEYWVGSGTVGSIAKSLAGVDTLYKQDTAYMFQQLVHNSLLEVLDALTATASLPALAAMERRPMLRGFYQ